MAECFSACARWEVGKLIRFARPRPLEKGNISPECTCNCNCNRNCTCTCTCIFVSSQGGCHVPTYCQPRALPGEAGLAGTRVRQVRDTESRALNRAGQGRAGQGRKSTRCA